MKRPRMRRWPLLLDERTASNLLHRSRAHGVTRPVWVRSLINGERPGSTPGSAAAAADAWWDSRTPARRAAIYRNHCAGAPPVRDDDAQATIYDTGAPL